VFGYSQVDEAVNLVDAMLIQELRLLAVRLNPTQAFHLLDALIAALPVEAPPDAERHQL
jgi:hypothetical protein